MLFRIKRLDPIGETHRTDVLNKRVSLRKPMQTGSGLFDADHVFIVKGKRGTQVRVWLTRVEQRFRKQQAIVRRECDHMMLTNRRFSGLLRTYGDEVGQREPA